jgi:serine protease Do
MTQPVAPNPQPPRRNVTVVRRLALLASAAGVGAVLLMGGPGQVLQLTSSFASAVHAATAQAAESAKPAGFADVVEKVKPAVISVRVKIASVSGNQMSTDGMGSDDGTPAPGSPLDKFFRQFGQGLPDSVRPHQKFAQAQGSGFFVSADGYAVTNNHVVDHASSVDITTDQGKTYSAKVVGTDAKTDVALLKVNGGSDFPYVRFADAPPRVGDWVIAVGNPFGLGGTVTAGIVSARGRDIGSGPYDDFIQIDAPVNRGNSGGPAFDENGNVVGVTTAIYSPSGGSVGIGFAIPSDTVKTVVAQLKDNGAVTRGWIGVQIQPVTADIADSLGLKSAQGALVAEAQDGGPAAKAGITSGDVIRAVNGAAVKDARDLAKKIAAQPPGMSVQLDVVRNGSDKKLSLTLGEMPKQRQARNEQGDDTMSHTGRPLGLALAPAARVAGAGDKGVVVTDVNPDGPAATEGVRTGDVILDVSGKPVLSPADVQKALADARTGGKPSVLMRLRSGDSTRFVALPVG